MMASLSPIDGLLRRLPRKLRRAVFGYRYRHFQNLGPDRIFVRGTANWLIHREIIYGGFQNNIQIGDTSPLDPRNEAEIHSDRMQGGDRMLFHGYAKDYSRYLKLFDYDSRLVIAEFGILRGHGLALWCDLFPNARVLGFDIDTRHFEKNRDDLVKRGAFSLNCPEIYGYDQFVESQDYLRSILRNDMIDICIDDGCHFDEAITCTMKSVLPNLSSRFVYFIEDNNNIHKQISLLYPELGLFSRGRLTVLDRGQ